MITLALDTSGRSESVATLKDGVVLVDQTIELPNSHSEHLLPNIDLVLKKAGLSLSQIDLYALTVGPGSFTGLRIGISTVKAFCKVHPKPVAAVSTLLALAEPLLETGKIIVSCLDARLGEVFVAAYQKDAEGAHSTLLPPQLMAPQGLIETLAKIPGEKILLGPGVVIHADSVGRLGEVMASRGETIHGDKLKAQYLRLSEAENRLLRNQN